MVGRSKTYRAKAQTTEINHNVLLHRYTWGVNDKLPNELLRAINNSGTAVTCVSRLKSFIQADGFANEISNTLQVNPNQTAEDLLSSIAPSVGIFEGFALRILYRMNGEVGSIYKVPLKSLRKLDNGDYLYNPLFYEKLYKQSDNIIIRPFNSKVLPSDRIGVIKNEIKKHGVQLGEILMVFQEKEIHNGDIYPVPDCYSGLEDIETDAALQIQDKRNVKKGFKANVIITMPGEVDNQTKDENEKTEQDYLDDTLSEFTNPDGSSIALLQSKTPGAVPKIEPFPIADILNGTSGARDRIPRFVCRHFSVPPVLIGLEVAAILGNAQAVLNSIEMFLLIIKDRQKLIERAFKKVYPNYDWTLTKNNPFRYIPPDIFALLTQEQKNKIVERWL